MAPRSRGVGLAEVGLKGRLTTPHLPAITGGIRFRLCCVHSPLLTASQFDFSSSPYADVSTQGVPNHYWSIEQEVSLGNPGIKGSMRLPRAYRSLARPSSVLEPSHPPDGTATPKQFTLKTLASFKYLLVC